MKFDKLFLQTGLRWCLCCCYLCDLLLLAAISALYPHFVREDNIKLRKVSDRLLRKSFELALLYLQYVTWPFVISVIYHLSLNTFYLTSITQEAQRTYRRVLEGADVGVLWP